MTARHRRCLNLHRLPAKRLRLKSMCEDPFSSLMILKTMIFQIKFDASLLSRT